MTLESTVNGSSLTVKLKGELDHHAATQILKRVGEQIEYERPTALSIDMRGVSFMDSSGIAVLLGSYRRMQEAGGSFSVCGVSDQSKKLLTAAGIDRLIPLT